MEKISRQKFSVFFEVFETRKIMASREFNKLGWRMGKSQRSFQTENIGRKDWETGGETAFYPFSAGEIQQTEKVSNYRLFRELGENKKPVNG